MQLVATMTKHFVSIAQRAIADQPACTVDELLAGPQSEDIKDPQPEVPQRPSPSHAERVFFHRKTLSRQPHATVPSALGSPERTNRPEGQIDPLFLPPKEPESDMGTEPGWLLLSALHRILSHDVESLALTEAQAQNRAPGESEKLSLTTVVAPMGLPSMCLQLLWQCFQGHGLASSTPASPTSHAALTGDSSHAGVITPAQHKLWKLLGVCLHHRAAVDDLVATGTVPVLFQMFTHRNSHCVPSVWLMYSLSTVRVLSSRALGAVVDHLQAAGVPTAWVECLQACTKSLSDSGANPLSRFSRVSVLLRLLAALLCTSPEEDVSEPELVPPGTEVPANTGPSPASCLLGAFTEAKGFAAATEFALAYFQTSEVCVCAADMRSGREKFVFVR